MGYHLTLFALVAQNGWKVYQMDVKTAFLNGYLKENFFMSQLEGFAVKGHEHKVCKVVKSLYGLKQAPRAWFGITECNPPTTPMEQNLKLTSIEGKEFEDATKYRQIVGSINYLTTTIPDISFAVGILSRFMQKPCEGHWSTAKRVLRYLKGTQDFGIKYTQVDDFSLIGYSDSDFEGDKETRVSTSGYSMSLGSRAISWRSRKQSVPADSTTEAEYMAAAEATKEIVWLRKILEYLQVKQVQSTPLMIDNTSAIKLAKNPKFHDQTKHINTKYRLIQHHVEAKTIHLRHYSTNEQIADIFTKALGREKLERFRMMLGLTNIPSD
eukprot:PITA_20448